MTKEEFESQTVGLGDEIAFSVFGKKEKTTTITGVDFENGIYLSNNNWGINYVHVTRYIPKQVDKSFEIIKSATIL